jgi:hypothetical protein
MYYDVCGYDCAVIVNGPATLDLNGHTVKGLRTAGTGATIKNGITNGEIGVENALIKNIIVTGDGLMEGDNSTLINVTAKDNEWVSPSTETITDFTMSRPQTMAPLVSGSLETTIK